MITVCDDSGTAEITEDRLELLRRLAAFLYRRLHLASEVELGVTLIDDEAMERLHEDWLDLPGTTDVMSFPVDELRAGTAQAPVPGGVLGDIVISPVVAARQAEEAGHSLDDELALLTVHGVLHLLGHDHAEDRGRTEMFGLQAALLEEFLGRSAPQPTDGGQEDVPR